MRLICPNCGAQYEVPDDVIPETGRDVQCSNCGNTWFQPHPDQDIDLAEELERALPDEEWQPDETEAEPEPSIADTVAAAMANTEDAPAAAPEEDTAPSRRGLDPSVAEVLRQEAEHEARQRASEASSLESQPDLGLEEPENDANRRAREARDRMARLRGEQPVQNGQAAQPAQTVEEVESRTANASRGGVLPDIDDINATLRSTGDRKTRGKPGKAKGAVVTESAAQRRGRGFRSGFGLTLLIAAAAIVVYVNADRIVELVPQSRPVIEFYVTKVTEARYWLDTEMVDAMLWLDEKAAAAGGNTAGFGNLTPPSDSN